MKKENGESGHRLQFEADKASQFFIHYVTASRKLEEEEEEEKEEETSVL